MYINIYILRNVRYYTPSREQNSRHYCGEQFSYIIIKKGWFQKYENVF